MPCAPPDQNDPPTLHGEAVTRPVSPEGAKRPIDIAALKEFRDSLPYQGVSATDQIREMRDSRY